MLGVAMSRRCPDQVATEKARAAYVVDRLKPDPIPAAAQKTALTGKRRADLFKPPPRRRGER